jgi:hypothetical protein
MDLILLVLVLALVGCVVWLIMTHIPMPPHWATVIQVGALIVVILYVVSRVGGGLPNLLR